MSFMYHVNFIARAIFNLASSFTTPAYFLLLRAKKTFLIFVFPVFSQSECSISLFSHEWRHFEKVIWDIDSSLSRTVIGWWWRHVQFPAISRHKISAQSCIPRLSAVLVDFMQILGHLKGLWRHKEGRNYKIFKFWGHHRFSRLKKHTHTKF